MLTPPQGASATKRVAFRSQFVHVAVGYPGLKYLPELQRYRTEHNDYRHIVNAYESHEHVYERLMQPDALKYNTPPRLPEWREGLADYLSERALAR